MTDITESDIEKYQQQIDYCMNITTELIERGVVQQYEDDVYPCVESPVTPQIAQEMRETMSKLDEGEIMLVSEQTKKDAQEVKLLREARTQAEYKIIELHKVIDSKDDSIRLRDEKIEKLQDKLDKAIRKESKLAQADEFEKLKRESSRGYEPLTETNWQNCNPIYCQECGQVMAWIWYTGTLGHVKMAYCPICFENDVNSNQLTPQQELAQLRPIVQALREEYQSFKDGFSRLEGFCINVEVSPRNTIREIFESILASSEVKQ